MTPCIFRNAAHTRLAVVYLAMGDFGILLLSVLGSVPHLLVALEWSN